MAPDTDLQASADNAEAQIAWARRSMPLSENAAGKLKAGVGLHIGLALPLDRANAGLICWLIEAGFRVSVLSENPSGMTADLIAALSKAGAAICDRSEAFLEGEYEIVLSSEGALLAPAMRGAVLTGSDIADYTAQFSAPVIDLGAAPIIQMCVSRHGVGQACVSGFLDLTNLQIAGGHVLVIGYDAIGEGVAQYARSYGGQVMVCEADPSKGVRAVLDGHTLAQLDDALTKAGSVFHTLHDPPFLSLSQIEQLPSGAFLCSATNNMRAFPISELQTGAPGKVVRDHVRQYELATGANVKLMCDGMPIHTRTGQGLPLEYADVQVAAQLLAIAELAAPDCDLKPGLHPLCADIETELAIAFLNRD